MTTAKQKTIIDLDDLQQKAVCSFAESRLLMWDLRRPHRQSRNHMGQRTPFELERDGIGAELAHEILRKSQASADLTIYDPVQHLLKHYDTVYKEWHIDVKAITAARLLVEEWQLALGRLRWVRVLPSALAAVLVARLHRPGPCPPAGRQGWQVRGARREARRRHHRGQCQRTQAHAGLILTAGPQDGSRRCAPTVGERRRALSASGASSFSWKRSRDGCARPGCHQPRVALEYSRPFRFLRCEDCPHGRDHC